jgi:hypothetical protein
MAVTQTPRSTAKELGKYLETMPWQLYATLTFPYDISVNGACASLRRFINKLEFETKGDVAYAGAMETRHYSGCGMSGVRAHFHLLMASEHTLDAGFAKFVKKAWTAHAGRGQNKSAIGGAVQDSADVRLFESGKGGAEYCVKVTDDLGDWIQRNLEIMTPVGCRPGRSARRQRRSRSRCSRQ